MASLKREDILLGKFKTLPYQHICVYSPCLSIFLALFLSAFVKSRAPQDRLQLAIGLGLVNLFGAIYVGEQWSSFQPPISAVLFYLSRALLFYAWAYLITPLCRLALISRYNSLIDERNTIRRLLLDEFNQQVSDPKSAVTTKLEFAFKYRKEVCVGKGGGDPNIMSI